MLKQLNILQAFLAIIISLLFVTTHLAAAVRLPSLIGDGMILQRNVKLNIWGWASPGEKIRIKFNHKKYAVITAANGQWLIKIASMKNGGPYEMDIRSSNNSIVLHDIMIGDVWFCSGQSNMVLNMERVKERYSNEIAAANYPYIRNFFI